MTVQDNEWTEWLPYDNIRNEEDRIFEYRTRSFAGKRETEAWVTNTHHHISIKEQEHYSEITPFISLCRKVAREIPFLHYSNDRIEGMKLHFLAPPELKKAWKQVVNASREARNRLDWYENIEIERYDEGPGMTTRWKSGLHGIETGQPGF